MMNTKGIIGASVVLITIILSGCNSAGIKLGGSDVSREHETYVMQPAYRSSPQLSPANNIAHAAKVDGLKDSTLANTKDYNRILSRGLLSPASVGFNLLSGSISGLSLALFPRQLTPREVNHLWYWTPAGETHIDVAQAAGNSLLKHAKTFSAANAKSESYKGHYEKKGYEYDMYAIAYTNGDCDGIKPRGYPIDCGVGFPDTTSGKAELSSSRPMGFYRGTTEARMPDFISPDGSLGKFSAAGVAVLLGLGTAPDVKVNVLSGMIEVSKDLPDTAYIYLAPNRYTLESNGNIVFGKVPVVLNQGNIMPFIVFANH